MIRKRASSKLTPARQPKKLKVFLETSAQILRIAGSPEMKRGINELVYGADKVGTSRFVKREFETVLIAFYRAVAQAAERLPYPSRPQLFEDMWQEIEPMMNVYYPGGPNLFPHLNERMNAMFRGKFITPDELRHSFNGHEAAARESFIEGKLHDKSSCGVWDNEEGKCDCAPEPGGDCRLSKTCVERREGFLAGAKTIADGRRAESKWFKANLLRLYSAEGKALLELIGKHPNHVGDLVIFWEVPDGWTILTRDPLFKDLKVHRRRVKVYIVRLPRPAGGGKCRVRFESNGEGFIADLIDFNAKGARVRADSVEVPDGAIVFISADEFASERRGKVIHHSKDDPRAFGVKLPLPRNAGT